MKNAMKLLLVTAIIFITLFACVAGCRKSTAHVHVYDDQYDAVCNTCGHVRVPAQRPFSEINSKPDTGVGFVIDGDTDGLILEGLDGEYILSESIPSLNFTALELNVYLSSGGEKGAAVPKENYSLIVTYGGERQTDLENLTADGTYTVTVVLKDVNRTISLNTNFVIVNPVTAFRFVSGTTTQYISETDNMSADWIFEAVRANGDKFTVPKSKVDICAIITDTAGTRTVDAEYAGFTEQIVCTVAEPPQAIERIEVKYDNSEKFVDEGGVFSVFTDDFTVYVFADCKYNYESSYVLVYQGAECDCVDLPAGSEAHAVTLKAVFTYTVENQTFTQVLERQVHIKVTARIGEENSVLVFDVAEISGLAENGKGAIKVVPSDNVCVVSCDGVEICGRTFDAALSVACGEDGFKSGNAITLSIKQPAVITVYFSADVFGLINFEDADGNICNSDDYYPGCGNARLTYHVGSGEYALSVIGAVNIYRIEAAFI